jgi:hypothetical protein
MAGHPHGDELGLINTFSKKSCNCVLSSANSLGGIRYVLLEIGAVPGLNSITKSTSLYGGNLGKSIGNTSGNSHTTEMSCISCTMAPKTCPDTLARADTGMDNLTSFCA